MNIDEKEILKKLSATERQKFLTLSKKERGLLIQTAQDRARKETIKQNAEINNSKKQFRFSTPKNNFKKKKMLEDAKKGVGKTKQGLSAYKDLTISFTKSMLSAGDKMNGNESEDKKSSSSEGLNESAKAAKKISSKIFNSIRKAAGKSHSQKSSFLLAIVNKLDSKNNQNSHAILKTITKVRKEMAKSCKETFLMPIVAMIIGFVLLITIFFMVFTFPTLTILKPASDVVDTAQGLWDKTTGFFNFWGGDEKSTLIEGDLKKVSKLTLSYKPLIEKYCKKYKIDEYVLLCLAMLQQESSGNPPDVMQSSASYYNKPRKPITSAEQSINYGVHQFSDCLRDAKVKGPTDIERICLALQGYNYGNGYIPWAIKRDKGYTKENAKLFSEIWKKKGGYSSYGDTNYPKNVLQYYNVTAPNQKAEIIKVLNDPKATKILKELKLNNIASAERWDVIETGATLVGFCKYSMPERQADGRNKPTILDCSSFTAWAFHKAGFKDIPYSASTATFRLPSSSFKTISAKDLVPGDIALKSATAGTGGANHVGIYCGKLKNGTRVWMHCTSSSGTSLTGNRSGVMLGAYTNFTYFRRYTKFKDKFNGISGIELPQLKKTKK